VEGIELRTGRLAMNMLHRDATPLLEVRPHNSPNRLELALALHDQPGCQQAFMAARRVER
jgi:hypothetical protein